MRLNKKGDNIRGAFVRTKEGGLGSSHEEIRARGITQWTQKKGWRGGKSVPSAVI